MQKVLQQLAPSLRAAGFRGSGQNYRKLDGDFVFVVNFQGSRWGDNFFINLGAQPVFIPTEGPGDMKKLKEYECVFRTRVGREWPWQLSEEAVAALAVELMAAQKSFFGHVQSLPTALATQPVEVLLRDFTSGMTEASATLHLARAALALGQPEKARAIVSHGLELAGDATGLRAALKEVLDSIDRKPAKQGV